MANSYYNIHGYKLDVADSAKYPTTCNTASLILRHHVHVLCGTRTQPFTSRNWMQYNGHRPDLWWTQTSSVTSMLIILQWTSLEEGWIKNKDVMMYKIVHGLVCSSINRATSNDDFNQRPDFLCKEFIFKALLFSK